MEQLIVSEKTGCTTLLLIDYFVKDYSVLIDSTNANTLPILYSYLCSKETLIETLRVKFTTIDRMGILFTQGNANLFLDKKHFFVEENVEFDLDTLDMYVKVAYPDLRKCIQLVQQNSTEGNLEAPNKGDAGEAEWKFDMVALFKAGKINEARKLLCGKLRAEEMVEVYTWLYTNIEVFGDEEKQNKAILIINDGI
jgi:hypothetical protein